MDLSVIIVNYRGWKRLSECLDSLSGLKTSGITSEVIIVDNNSDDGKLDEFKKSYPDFNFISSALNGGFGYGCNLGSRHAKGEILLFLNPDTVAEGAVIEKLFIRAKDNPGNYISSCRQVDEMGRESKAYGIFPGFGTLTGMGRAIFRLLNKKKIKEKPDEGNIFFNPDWISGSVIMIKKETFDSIGGFDEDYWLYSEDMDLCRRARNIGGNIVFYTDIVIQHNHGGNSRINLKTISLTKTEVMISGHLYLSKHKPGINGFLLQSWLILYNLLAGLFSGLAGLILFFKPKMLAKTNIYLRLLGYYAGASRRRTWISQRSVNFPKS